MKNLKPSISKDEKLLIDFCNVKEWNPDTILDLKIKTKAGYEKYLIDIDSEDDLIPENRKVRNCSTRHDTQHTYCLIENDRSKILQSKIPETFVLPSQPEFQKLYKYLQKSQEVYRKFLDSCIKGHLDLPYLNNLITNIENPKPMFITNPKTFSGKVKKREQESIKWNPIVYLMAHGKCIEDTIEFSYPFLFPLVYDLASTPALRNCSGFLANCIFYSLLPPTCTTPFYHFLGN